MPLKRYETPGRSASHPAGLSLRTALLDESTGHGRMVRDEDGAIARIAAEKDASATEKNSWPRWRAAMQLECARELMRNGVMPAEPWCFDLRGELARGHDVSIDVNCLFEDKVSLANDVRIGAVVGKHYRIAPYALLRPGTQLGYEVHGGHFRRDQGEGIWPPISKANYLIYTGDSSMRTPWGNGNGAPGLRSKTKPKAEAA